MAITAGLAAPVTAAPVKQTREQVACVKAISKGAGRGWTVYCVDMGASQETVRLSGRRSIAVNLRAWRAAPVATAARVSRETGGVKRLSPAVTAAAILECQRIVNSAKAPGWTVTCGNSGLLYFNRYRIGKVGVVYWVQHPLYVTSEVRDRTKAIDAMLLLSNRVRECSSAIQEGYSRGCGVIV